MRNALKEAGMFVNGQFPSPLFSPGNVFSLIHLEKMAVNLQQNPTDLQKIMGCNLLMTADHNNLTYHHHHSTLSPYPRSSGRI